MSDIPEQVLVIEDADTLRKDIVEILSYEGFNVLEADNGHAGIELALEHQPALIICDIMMPQMDGFQVLEALRENALTASIPFIFLTARTDRVDIRHGMGAGADDYLTKPFVATELIASVKARLSKQRTLDNMAQDRLRELSDSIITALPHELRTPLNTVIGFSDMLLAEPEKVDAERLKEWAGYINNAGHRLYRLVENYLAYVNAVAMLQDPAKAQEMREHVLTYPGSVIHLNAASRARLYEREADLRVDLTPVDVPVKISEDDLGKIVTELVDNALKFSKQGTDVRVQTLVDESWYVLIIADHGRGMSQDQIYSIAAHLQFDRWVYEQQGTGLGLAIVKRFLELYGGSLHIESDEQGTQTYVRIGRAAQHSPRT